MPQKGLAVQLEIGETSLISTALSTYRLRGRAGRKSYWGATHRLVLQQGLLDSIKCLSEISGLSLI